MPTFIQIGTAKVVGSGGASSIDFTSIPGTFTDLYLVTSIRGSNATPFSTVQLTINSSTSTFSNRILEVDTAASAGSSGSPNRYVGYLNASTSTSNTFASASIYFTNYATNQYKSYSIDYTSGSGGTSNWLGFVSGLWSTTSAITAISLVASSGNLLQNSTAYLYGVSNA